MAQKVEAQGGLGGDVWDDGVYDGVRKVHVGQGQDGVSFINAVYEKGSQCWDIEENDQKEKLAHDPNTYKRNKETLINKEIRQRLDCSSLDHFTWGLNTDLNSNLI